MSYGKIVFGGISIAITGWMLLIGIPLMFSALFWFINQIYSIILFFVSIIILGIFVYAFLNK